MHTPIADDPKPRRIGFLLIPQFSMMAFSAAVEPLRSANRLHGGTAYEWRLFSPNGEPVPASNGILIVPNAGLDTLHWSQTLFVCASLATERWASPGLLRQLQGLARRGVALGSISYGTYLLAAAGLLDNYRCTTHWENLAALQERFPHLNVTDRIYELDRDRYTCSGGTAALDMMLHKIAEDYSQELALAVSAQFIHERLRAPGEQQQTAELQPLLRQSPKLARAINLMKQHIEKPLPSKEIAQQIGLSLRQLERLFHTYKNHTPQRYYLELRLAQAQRLLAQTGLAVMHIALATGFASQSHFTKCYRERYGITPRQERQGNRYSATPRPSAQHDTGHNC